MKKFLKFAVGAILGIIVLLLVIPFFIPADTYKSLLVAQVKKLTGRELVIGGDASLRIFPNVALNVNDVTLSNPAGFSDKELTKIGKLSVNVALQPLFDKRLEMKGATIEDATLSLEEREDGTKSWEMMPAVQGVTDETPTPKEESAKQDLSKIILGAVNIKNSNVTYKKAGQKPMVLKDINLTVDSSGGFASELKADFSANFNGGDVAFNATIDNAEQFMNGKATGLDVKASLPDAKVTFKGDGAMGKAIVAKGKLDANVSDLHKLTAWATGKASSGPKSISLNGDASIIGSNYEIKTATLEVDGTKATGNIGADLSGAVPNIKGNLAFGMLDIDAITKKPAVTQSFNLIISNAYAQTESWSNEAIDVSALRAVNANLALTATGVKSGKLELGSTSGKVNLSGGNLRINDIATALYGGTATGSLSVNGASGTPAIGTDIAIKGVQIEPLMTALAGKSRLAGTANLSFDLTGSGKSQRAIMSSLAGKGAMKVTDGAILGINLGKFLRDAKKGFLFDSGSERTDFAELTGTFSVANGIVSNSDLNMLAPLLRLTGQGTASLPAQNINYRLLPKIAATTKGQGGKEDKAGITIPLLISGPWANPSVTPDLAGMVEEGLKDPEAMKQNIKNIGDSLKDYNSKDDLKRAIFGGGKEEAPAPTTTPTEGSAPATQPAPAPEKQKPEDAIKNLLKAF